MKRASSLGGVAVACAAVLALAGGCAGVDDHGLLGSVPATCSTSPLAGAPEDIAPDPAAGVFYVSASQWRTRASGTRPPPGAIYRAWVEDGVLRSEPLAVGAPDDFQPHGISLLVLPDGRRLLFVVNQAIGPPDAPPRRVNVPPRIEIFEGSAKGPWRRARTVELAIDARPNDVAALDEHSFYVTNDHGARRKQWGGLPSWAELREDFLGPHRGSVLFVGRDGIPREAASGLAFPNGIALSPERHRLFVAETMGGRVSVYEPVGRDGRLRPARPRTIHVGTGPDNLYAERADRVWVARHSDLLAFTLHAANRRARSPGHVAVFDPRAAKPRVETRYRTSGAPLSAISVGVPAGERVLLGSVFTRSLMLCPRTKG